MPWEERSVMSQRTEFVHFATQEGANISELCRRYSISRDIGHKWLNRYKAGGVGALEDRSRRPCRSPNKTPESLERKILEVRDEHPAWGGRKINRRLQNLGFAPPAPSTITEVLRRNDRLTDLESDRRQAVQRFEHPVANALWQMDFKGHFPLTRVSSRCHPLTVLDDHSRFSIALEACPNERGNTVQRRLEQSFQTYGLPECMLTDNGAPWWGPCGGGLTQLSMWLVQLGIRLVRCRPRHPQTQGKDERFHRSLKAEVLAHRSLTTFVHCQQEFDRWRTIYNFDRPHEALDMEVPATRYEPSSRPFPTQLPPIEYGPEDHTRKVRSDGSVSYQGRRLEAGQGLKGRDVAVRHTGREDHVEVYFCSHKLGSFNLAECGKAR